MKKRIMILLISVMIALVSVMSLDIVSSDPPEIFVPAYPDSDSVQLSSWMENETAFITVTIGFSSCCWKIGNWSSLVVNDNDFSVDSEVLYWLGPCCQMVWAEVQTFELGQLDEGLYTFTYMCWGNSVRSVSFEVGFPADINDDGKYDMKDVALVAILFGVHNPDPTYDPNCDLNSDGEIGMKDVSRVAMHFGEEI